MTWQFKESLTEENRVGNIYVAVEKKSKGDKKRWKANEEMRRKLHENLGLGDCALKDLDLKTLLVIQI